MKNNPGGGEFDFIKKLSSICETGERRVICGVGDDCAVYTSSGEMWELVTTDAMVEGVHFSLDYFSPEQLGARLASINISDIAAMGGEPRFALISLSSPPQVSEEFLLKLYRGLTSVLNGPCVEIIGGNTTASPAGLSLHMTIIGSVEKERVLFRDGAKPGELIFVTGELGDSAAGLEILGRAPHASEKSWAELGLIKKHIAPVARLREGRVLSESRLVSSMMDISDGLSSDLSRICERSGTGALIAEESLPLSKELSHYKASKRGEALALALHGGEDYELLFTAPASEAHRVFSLVSREGIKVTRVGSITGGSEVRLKKEDGNECPLEPGGYDHFMKRPGLK